VAVLVSFSLVCVHGICFVLPCSNTCWLSELKIDVDFGCYVFNASDVLNTK
jgi:hypothetical protein